MSTIKLADDTVVYLADADVTNGGVASYTYDYILFKNTPTFIRDLFPTTLVVGQTITFENGSYWTISSVAYWASQGQFNINMYKVGGVLAGNATISSNEQNYGRTFLICDKEREMIWFGKPSKAKNKSSFGLPGAEFWQNFQYYNWQNFSTDKDLWVYPAYSIENAATGGTIVFDDVIVSTYFPGDESSGGGGTGSFDTTSDDISFPSVPTLSAVAAGFITLFAPTIGQLNSLASYMWSSSFDLDAFKKLFADPMDAIIGVSIVPVTVPISGSQEVKIGFVGTGVTMNLASTQYVTVDCGSLSIGEYWGSALDYSPYTKFSIYLPYIGTRELNTDDIMGKTVQVKYNIDILSGSCTAMVKCGGSVLYEYSGSCALSIPVTGRDFTQLLTAGIQLASVAVSTAATGGASAAGLVTAAANAVSAMKPNIQRTGAVSGAAGMLGVQQPYLICELPRQSLASDYKKFVGYPSNITALLSTLTGYTQIESVHLENISATQTELAEIESLLKEGVII